MENEQPEPPQHRTSTKAKTLLYHASGASDFVYAKKVLMESVAMSNARLRRLKGLLFGLPHSEAANVSQKNYVDFHLSPATEQALLATLKSRKQRYLILLAVVGVVWLCAAAVVVATCFVDQLMLAIYLKSISFLLMVSALLAYAFIQSTTVEFLAWQIVNQCHSRQEQGDFNAFKVSGWLRSVLDFSQCGVRR